MFKYFLVFLSLTQLASADSLCGRSRLSLKDLLQTPASRIAFRNSGGLFNGGVCWWHSRLQRSSLYLTQYDVTKPKPSAAAAALILSSLRHMNQVVTIPGYTDFQSFSRDYQAVIQKTLNDWQKSDGIINSEWTRGLSGSWTLPASKLEAQMKNVFHFYQTSPTPLWVMAQMKGITSHSFLITNMTELPRGFELEVIDSNRPLSTRRISYQYGDQTLKLSDGEVNFVLYVGFQNDFNKISQSLKNHCQNLSSEGFAPVELSPIESDSIY